MKEKYLFDDETKERFNDIGSKLYTIKYALETIKKLVEDECEVDIGMVSILTTIEAYFNKAKEEYNKLEKDLGVLI